MVEMSAPALRRFECSARPGKTRIMAPQLSDRCPGLLGEPRNICPGQSFGRNRLTDDDMNRARFRQVGALRQELPATVHRHRKDRHLSAYCHVKTTLFEPMQVMIPSSRTLGEKEHMATRVDD